MSRPVKNIKKQICFDILKEEFSNIKDHRPFSMIKLRDILMSSFALFDLKYPSLLQFDQERHEPSRKYNLKSLYQIEKIPSDTQLRDVLDGVDSSSFRGGFKKIFSHVQRSKSLELFNFISIRNKPHYLLAVDGTGYFRSDKIGCLNCNSFKSSSHKKQKKFGHSMLAGSLVHPNLKQVIPVFPEAIIMQDGRNKNDCELNAFKRFVPELKRDHPKLNIIFTLDALYATEPPIKLLFENDYSFIIAIKETNGAVFDQVSRAEISGDIKRLESTHEIGEKVKKQVIRRYRFLENVHLNQDPRSTRVNFIEFWEDINWVGKRGKEQTKKVHFAWITDLEVNENTIEKITKGARARWKIENETFNVLKNQGYNLEHNYGHGSHNLSVNFIMMMLLSFLVDQVQELSCQQFKKALELGLSRSRLWRKMLSAFDTYEFEKWEHFYQCLSNEGLKIGKYIPPNSS